MAIDDGSRAQRATRMTDPVLLRARIEEAFFEACGVPLEPPERRGRSRRAP